jgi:hypothetical protein
MVTQTQKKLITATNAKISKMTKLGEREVTTTSTGYVLEWSNGLKRWQITYQKKAGKHELDANELIVEAKESDIAAIVSHLHELPLYKYSFEAKMRR